MADKSKLWARRLWGKSKKRAREAGIEFTITPGDIHVPEVCPIFHVPLEFGKGISDSLPSLDRIDSAIGYLPGNVRVISWRANYLKKNATLEQLERMVAYMKGEI
jgi:hypothetical protein